MHTNDCKNVRGTQILAPLSLALHSFQIQTLLTFGATVRLLGEKMISHLILYSNLKTNEVAKGGGGAVGERGARCQRAPHCRLQPVKSPVHAGPALEAARTVQLFSP